MSRLLTPRPARPATGVLITGLLALTLAACGSNNVSCSGPSCTATLNGNGATASILGQSLAFAGTQNGRATLSVGNASVSCAQGERVSAGPLSLTCTTVTQNSVQITATLA